MIRRGSYAALYNYTNDRKLEKFENPTFLDIVPDIYTPVVLHYA
jgi:hypothetical protein